MGETMSVRRLLLVAAPLVMIACGSGTAPKAPDATPSAKSGAIPLARDNAVPTRLRSTIASTLKIDESTVTPNAAFTTDLGADELSMVELVMAYEREFKVDIRDDDASRFQRVQDVVAFLQQRGALR